VSLTQFLQNHHSFKKEEIDFALSFFEEIPILKNGFFLKEGSVCREVAFIEKGAVIYWQMLDGEEKTVDFAFEGDWITQYQSLNSGTPSVMSIQTIQDTVLMSLSAEKMKLLFQQLPAMQEVRTALAENYFVRYSQYATDLANLSGEARYEKLMRERPGVFQRLPLSNIASYLGITQRHLSRIRSTVR